MPFRSNEVESCLSRGQVAVREQLMVDFLFEKQCVPEVTYGDGDTVLVTPFADVILIPF